MGMSQRRRAALQQRAKELGFDGGHRSYAVTDVIGGLGQLAWRAVVGLGVFALGMMIIMRPPSAALKITVTAAVLLAWFGLMLGWRRMSAALELHRCHLYPGGVVVTNILGQVRDAVAWADVTAMRHTYGAYLLTVSHRIELSRRGAAPLAFVIMGSAPALVTAAQEQAARHNTPQHTIRFEVS
jgi:hypothetical protein